MGLAPADISDFLKNLFSLHKIDSTIKFGVVWDTETGEKWNGEKESLLTGGHLTHNAVAVSGLALHTVLSSQHFNNTKLL